MKSVWRWKVVGFAVVSVGLLAGALTLAGQAAQTQSSDQSAPQAQPQGRGRGRGRGIAADDPAHPVMPIGSPAPTFNLPGIDGKNHTLSEYANAKILLIVFESNHCPASIGYEGRIRGLYEDYKDKGLQLVAINPNNASAVRLNELGYTDMTDSLPEMKVRATYRHIDWPYVYDGETQATSSKFGVIATPHVFIFDHDRKLRYEGRIDDSLRESNVKTKDARNAIEAMLAGQPVSVEKTRPFGCSTKWLDKATGVEEEMAKIKSEPVTLQLAGADDLKQLRQSAGNDVLVVNFWSLHCKACVAGFHDLETTNRMYRLRTFKYVTVSTDKPADHDAVLSFLKEQYASNTNLQFATTDKRALQAAFGLKWNANQPFTVVLGKDGSVIYQKQGSLDVLQLRRYVLANMPDNGDGFAGVQAFWKSVISAD